MKCTEEAARMCLAKIKYNRYLEDGLCDKCCIYCPGLTSCNKVCEVIKEKRSSSLVIYIAGKITGDTNYKEKFYKAERHLTELGYTILNPAWLPSTGLEYEQYMRIGSAMLSEADAIFLLPDYRESPGTLREINQAIKQKKRILR